MIASALVSQLSRNVSTESATAATISAINSSSIGPGPLGMRDTSPIADAPSSMAVLASSTLAIQQIFTLVTGNG